VGISIKLIDIIKMCAAKVKPEGKKSHLSPIKF
jgi:hypothetical protein